MFLSSPYCQALPDLADGGDNPWWGGLEDLDFLGNAKSNLGDKDMTVEQARSYLGLKEGVNYDRKTMRKQYHRVCAKWHPDKNPNNTMAKQYFQKIQDAYELLGPKAMRNGRLKDLGKRSCKHVALFSAWIWPARMFLAKVSFGFMHGQLFGLCGS